MGDVKLEALQALRDGKLSVDGALRQFRQSRFPAPSSVPRNGQESGPGHHSQDDSAPPQDASPWQDRFRGDLLEMVAGILKVDSSAIDLATSVMDLGLDSLSAAEFNNLVRARFGISMSPTIFFESNSVKDFCTNIVKSHEASIRSHYLGSELHRGNGRSKATRDGSRSPAGEEVAASTARSDFAVERIWNEIAAEVAAEDRSVPPASLDLDRAVVTPAGGIPIELFIGGKGDPLLLLGGLLNPPEIWRNQLPLLCESHRVIVYQPPGVGRSGVDREALTLDSIVEGIVGALDLLNVLAPVSVVGYSFGGVVAQHLSLRHPQRVAALVLISSTARFAEDGLDPAALRDELLQSPEAQEINRQVDLDLLPAYRRAVRGLDVRDRLQTLKVPALVMVGAEDKYMKPKFSQDIHRAVSESEYSEVEGAAHLLLLTHPQAVNERMQSFLESRSLRGERDR